MSWAPHLKKISPGTAGQGVSASCSPQPLWTVPAHWGTCGTSTGPAATQGTNAQSRVTGQDAGSRNWNPGNCLNIETKTFLTMRVWVARCWNWLPRKAVKCPCLEMLRICGMWLALSSLLQLSLPWAGDWSRWSPEVPANLNPYCASVSLGEMVGTQGLPKYKSDFCCFPTHALEMWVSYRKNWLKMVSTHFFLWIKNGCSPTYCRAQWNKVKEGRWPTSCIGSSGRMGWAIKQKTKGQGPGRDAWLLFAASMKRQR